MSQLDAANPGPTSTVTSRAVNSEPHRSHVCSTSACPPQSRCRYSRNGPSGAMYLSPPGTQRHQNRVEVHALVGQPIFVASAAFVLVRRAFEDAGVHQLRQSLGEHGA